MRNLNYIINESYFNDASTDELADDIIATSIESLSASENTETFNNDDKDNCIMLSYELKGTKDMKILKDNIQRWSRSIFYGIDSLDLFDDKDDFFVMIRFVYPNEHFPLYYNYGKFYNSETAKRMTIKNMKSFDAGSVFDRMIEEYSTKRDTNKIIQFDLLIGYDLNDNNVKQEYLFWKRINKLRTYIYKNLSKIVKNKPKHWINVGLILKNKTDKDYFSVKTTNNLESISPEGYRDLLWYLNRFKNNDDLNIIKSLIDGMKEDVGAEIPYGFLNLCKAKNVEWLKASGLKMHKNGDVLECSFYYKAIVNIYHLLHIWYYGKQYCKNINCSEIKIDVPGTLELGTDLQERRFKREWWNSDCSVNVEKLVINGLKSSDLQRVLQTMNVKVADITRIGGLSNTAARRTVSLKPSEWKNPQTELTSIKDEIIYSSHGVTLQKK